MATSQPGRSKIGKTEWVVIYVVMGTLDFIQFVVIELILVWFFGIGIIVNEILDPIIGALFAIYLQLRGVNLVRRLNRLASIIGFGALAEITGGVAQLWILDVWYLHSDVKKEERELEAAEAQAIFLNANNQQTLYYTGPNGETMRSPTVSMNTERNSKRNVGGYRAPGGGLTRPYVNRAGTRTSNSQNASVSMDGSGVRPSTSTGSTRGGQGNSTSASMSSGGGAPSATSGTGSSSSGSSGSK